MFKKLLLRIRKTIWFAPAVYCFIASILALIVVLIDTAYNEQVKAYIPVFLRTTVDLAQTILGTISGALLTMTTITFSTIMVVLTTYSSQFSPRTLRNFLTAPSTLRVLGIFMGGFVYSILSLLFMRKKSIDHEVISASIGVIVAVICLAFFAYFIHNVATSIQVSRLIYTLTADALQTVKKEQEHLKKKKALVLDEKPALPLEYKTITEVQAASYGYIQMINYEKLLNLAVEKEAIIEINEPIGQFVTKKNKLLTIFSKEEELEINPRSFFTIGEERSTIQDVEYGIQKIVEIALRAVSPGINDPNTAVRCIHYLRNVLLEAFHTKGSYVLYWQEGNSLRLLHPRKGVERLLYASFSQLSFYGRQDISILFAMLDTLIYLALHSDEEIKKEIKKFGQYIIDHFDPEAIKELDQQYLNEKQHNLFAVTSK